MRYPDPYRILPRCILGVVVIQGILLLLGIPGQPCHVDEAWMGEQAYHEAKDGIARQELLSGMFGFENRMLIRHKLHIFLGGLLVRAFGLHLSVLRVVSLVSGLALLGMMHRYMRGRERNQGTVFLLAASILLAAPLMFRYVNIYRPEFLMTALGFAGFLFILRSMERKSASGALLAGAFSGLAVLAHLNGMMFVVAGTGVLLLDRKWKEMAIFLPVSLAVAALYLYDIAGHYDLFRLQFFNDFVVEKNDYQFLAPIVKLFQEHQRYFRTPEIIGISALFLVTLPLALRTKIREHRVFYQYLLLLVLALGVVGKSITTKYAIPVLPFFAIAAASSFSRWFRREASPGRAYGAVLAAAVIVHIGFGLYYGAESAFQEKPSLVSGNAAIASNMEPGSRIITPGRFIFNEIERFEIRDIHAARYLIIHEQKREFNLTALCEYAIDHRFDYIILDREYRAFGNIDLQRIFPPVWKFEVIREFADGTALLKKYDADETILSAPRAP